DLSNLIDIAAKLGAVGIGLNPLHALFDDRAEASPYFPSSRLFLNPLYVGVEAIPEFPQAATTDFRSAIEELRSREFVDYAGVADVKTKASSLAVEAFRQHGGENRHRQFDDCRRTRGPALEAFAAFELLRRRFEGPWQAWPDEFRKPDPTVISGLRSAN